MLALAEYRSRICPGCHGDLTETLAHDDWEPLPPVRCHRCTAIQIGQERFDGPHLSALRWGAQRRRW